MRMLFLLFVMPLCAAPARAQPAAPGPAGTLQADPAPAASIQADPTPAASLRADPASHDATAAPAPTGRDPAGVASAVPSGEPAAPAPGAAAAIRHRLGWEQRFAQANTSHDGHLTLEQARAGYVTIARHFEQIDAARKGFVTLDDIRAWHRQQRQARHRRAAEPHDPLRPRPAYHHTLLPAGAVPAAPKSLGAPS